MKLVIPIVALVALLLTLGWQQRWRAGNVIEEQGSLSDFKKESLCVLRSLEADICSILSNPLFFGPNRLSRDRL